MRKSIKLHLLLWLLIPLLTLAVLSTVAAYWLGVNLARDIYDKQLLNSADSVAARVKTRGERISVDLPPAAQSILRHNYHDEFYYQIISPDGIRIDGDQTLPLPPETTAKRAPIFRTVNINGKELRLVCVSVPTPDLSVDHVVIQVAETRNTRSALAGQITMSILIAQMLLISSGTAAIWIGVGRGLSPLAEVERTVKSRAPGDLSPLEVEEPVEIISLIRALNRLFRQLLDDIDAQKRFIANAAHQLRTPLAVLGTYCDLSKKLVQERKQEEALEVMDELEAGVNRMSKIVNRLLVLARSEPNVAGTIKPVLFDLNHCASTVTADLVPEALKKRIDLEFLSASEPALVLGDEPAIAELATNLIENGIMYSQNSGSVTVKLVVQNKRTRLTVSDDGPGIPEHERGHVFERFYRIQGTEQPGTGLGLAIVREIAAAHNAEVTITAGANSKGTSVSVLFPEAIESAESSPINSDAIANRKQHS